MSSTYITDLVGHWQYVWSSSCLWSDGSRCTGMALVPWIGRHSISICTLLLPGMLIAIYMYSSMLRYAYSYIQQHVECV